MTGALPRVVVVVVVVVVSLPGAACECGRRRSPYS